MKTIRAIFEFIVAFHSFSLLAELIIIPVTSVAGAMIAYSESKEEYKQVKSAMSWFLTVFGISMFILSLYYIFTEFSEFANQKTLMDFITPIILSILLLPFIFIFSIYIFYESILVRVNIYTNSKLLRIYAKIIGIMHFKRNYKSMREWLVFSCVSDFESKQSIKNSISFYNENKRKTV